MGSTRIPSYLLSAPRTRRPTLCTKLRRSYYDYSYGYREQRAFTLPDYTSAQLANRTANAPLLRYVDSLRTHGHRAARVDPLDLLQREEVAALSPERYGLADPASTYDINGIIWTRPVGQDAGPEHWPLEKITRHLREVYVGRVAYEYMHSPSKTERLWFSHLLEKEEDETRKLEGEKRKRIHKLLAESEVFDQFLQLKFPNLKRYGLEGGESMLPALDALFSSSAQAGVEHIIIGMPHRGRLNLLTGMLQLPPSALFHKIKGGSEIPEEYGAAGDVISHLTASPLLEYPGAAKPLHVSLLPNPSHLEAINPVALGKTRAKQFALLKALQSQGETECMPGDRVMCVQLHGDASFTGQGVVMEGLGLSNLPHYTVGGSVHLVVNNSIGYTTPASSARSSLYCSDVAKMINAPVLHVNGDYPEGKSNVQRAMDIAFKYRNYFRKDIIVDLIVYRRWGHNELDEPAFTQPLMYEKIRSRRSVPALYEEHLIDENVLTKDAAEAVRAQHKDFLASELASAPSQTPGSHVSVLQGQWKGITWPGSQDAVGDPETGVDREALQQVGRASVSVPEGFKIHPRLQRHVKNRLQAMENGTGLDWATAEALAFGSLMLEGYDVRISGQDVGRGTFSQRHAMLVDQRTEGVVVPLNLALGGGGRLELANSSLSEMAVLGFEYGVSWEKPDMLPIWEAQFGDFFNGAQVMIDTFISSGETKWLKQSGLVLLLPHGLDGAGPEHSSSRIERMLQLTNDPYAFHEGSGAASVNMHVTFPTTPAQYFHLLRRQVKRNFRKPLIVAGPKGLLRLPAAASSLDELSSGRKFRPVLDDSIANPADVSRVVLLSGKLYYDLVKERQKRQLEGKVAFIRVEELSPFPFRAVHDVLARYDSAESIVWLQEEPRNQGAWTHVQPRLDVVLKRLGRERVAFRGRKEDAVPAPGIASLYAAQQKTVIDAAFESL
ncbi:dehydrogenase E1 and transketolase domain-containing protein 1 [Dichomitus squalens LYAD-421 SS1]|uniref:Dehydrogenase E1 and transketolase domain-containing protein 1 n=1 Tax=Dichomitus squalens (strain LYAD-421) TaxID=732165 RepID=R7SRH7_DICSQ|nr:dehydrogenase E1 and transketolase domain-containing protein 1 [Dichomitus squalens LYAD-421 SS1]EJF58365.1 dehydrogenase E1 and transketolase domain-containing protein 1 [Dichomitus squalens LYAD-421 SS1]